MNWILALFGIGLGLVFGYMFGRGGSADAKKTKQLALDLEQTREELKGYRGEVTEHFSKTAELVNAMTANYRAVYGHLAEGAQKLCDGEAKKLEAMGATEPLPSSIVEHPVDEPTVDAEAPPPAEAESGQEDWYDELPPERDSAESRADETRVH